MPELLPAHIDELSRGEPGCPASTIDEELGDEPKVVLPERYESREALAVHRDAPYLRDLGTIDSRVVETSGVAESS
jgi:quinol monooxygenase YgiN